MSRPLENSLLLPAAILLTAAVLLSAAGCSRRTPAPDDATVSAEEFPAPPTADNAQSGESAGSTKVPDRVSAGSPGSQPPGRDDAHRWHGHWLSASFGGGGYIQNVVVSPGRPGRLFAYVDVGGLYRSDDGGLTWRMLHGGMPAGDGYYTPRRHNFGIAKV